MKEREAVQDSRRGLEKALRLYFNNNEISMEHYAPVLNSCIDKYCMSLGTLADKCGETGDYDCEKKTMRLKKLYESLKSLIERAGIEEAVKRYAFFKTSLK